MKKKPTLYEKKQTSILTPTFHPPSTNTFKNISAYDNVKLYFTTLSPASTEERGKSLPDRWREMKRERDQISPLIGMKKFKLDKINDDNNDSDNHDTISLFDGGIVMKNVSTYPIQNPYSSIPSKNNETNKEQKTIHPHPPSSTTVTMMTISATTAATPFSSFSSSDFTNLTLSKQTTLESILAPKDNIPVLPMILQSIDREPQAFTLSESKEKSSTSTLKSKSLKQLLEVPSPNVNSNKGKTISKSSSMTSKLNFTLTESSKSKTTKTSASSSTSSATAKKKKKKESEKNKKNTTFSLTKSNHLPSLSFDEFRGISGFCRNVGSSMAGFEAFRLKAQSSHLLVLSIIWSGLTTNHAITSKRYCTPSTQCNIWHCTCDKHVRIEQAYKPLIGAIVVFSDDDDDGDDNDDNHNDDKKVAYFIPLSYCSGAGDADHVKEDSTTLPLNCSVSLQDRWQLLYEILRNEFCIKVIYNCPVFMLPVMFNLSNIFVGNEGFKNIFDPRIAHYMTSQMTTSDTDLELESLTINYNLNSNSSSSSSSNGSSNSTNPSTIHTRTIINIGMVSDFGRVTERVFQLYKEMRILLRLYQIMNENLQTSGMIHTFNNIEMPLSLLLTNMEINGIRVSSFALKSLKEIVILKISEIVEYAHQLSKSSFNLASPDQVADVLYNQLKIPPPSGNTTTKRHYSTSEEDLLRIRDHHPEIIDAILSFRKLSKIISNNVEGLTTFLVEHYDDERDNEDEEDEDEDEKEDENRKNDKNNLSKLISGQSKVPYDHHLSYRVHALWNQTVVRTGRLSCCKPNLQNIPNTIEDVCGLNINVRSLFTATPGYTLISADYSQIEMRVMAHISGDEELERLFMQDRDIYRLLAASIFNKAVDSVDDSERNKAKTVCLGVMYGMRPQSTAQKLGISVADAIRIISTFFDRFKQLHLWMKQTKADAKEKGYVTTITERRRYIPEIQSSEAQQIAQGERQAVNSVIQGSASDLIKKAMIAIEDKLLDWSNPNTKPRILLQIHDELIYEMKIIETNPISYDLDPNMIVKNKDVQSFVYLLRTCMETSYRWKISTPTNIRVGFSWGDLIPFKYDDHHNDRIHFDQNPSQNSDQNQSTLSLTSRQYDLIRERGIHNPSNITASTSIMEIQLLNHPSPEKQLNIINDSTIIDGDRTAKKSRKSVD